MRNFYIRPIEDADEPFLWEMLYQALYVPEGDAPIPHEALAQPDIAHYVSEWGQPADAGFVAVDAHADRPVGAAWLRLFPPDAPGYGFVDAQTPEVSIALQPEWRGRGVGSELLVALLAYAETRHPAVSLSVDPRNPALRLYERLGFEPCGFNGGSLVMARRLRINPPG